MSIQKAGTTAPAVIYLSDYNNTVGSWTKMIMNDCKGNYGASGTAVTNRTDQQIPTPPTKSDTDFEGNYMYEHLPNSPALTDQGNKEYNADLVVFRTEDKLRQKDDTSLYRHILDTLSDDANRLIEINHGYPAFQLLPEGNRAVAFFNLAIAAHSAGDMLTKYSRFISWVTLRHDHGESILATLERVNTGADEFRNNFCDAQGMVDSKLMTSMISLACLPTEFHTLLQNIFFNNDPDLFQQPRKIHTQILSYASSQTPQRDDVSTQGQANRAYAAKSAKAPVEFCISCYNRTGNRFTGHGTLGTPPCRGGKNTPTPQVSFSTPTREPQSYMAIPSATPPPNPPMNFPQQYFPAATAPQQLPPPQVAYFPAAANPHQAPPAQYPVQLRPQVATTLRSFLASLGEGGSTEVTTSLLADLYDQIDNLTV
jgi:hypothetical protein